MWKLIKILTERFNNFMLYLGIALGATAGLLSGLGVGIVIGMFIAPRSGKELREGFRQRANDTFTSVNDSVRNFTAGSSGYSGTSASDNGGHNEPS